MWLTAPVLGTDREIGTYLAARAGCGAAHWKTIDFLIQISVW